MHGETPEARLTCFLFIAKISIVLLTQQPALVVGVPRTDARKTIEDGGSCGSGAGACHMVSVSAQVGWFGHLLPPKTTNRWRQLHLRRRSCELSVSAVVSHARGRGQVRAAAPSALTICGAAGTRTRRGPVARPKTCSRREPPLPVSVAPTPLAQHLSKNSTLLLERQRLRPLSEWDRRIRWS